jgi:hypothetical protein
VFPSYSDSFPKTISPPVKLEALGLVTGSPSLGCPRLILGLVATLHPSVRKTGIPYTGYYSVTFRGQIFVKGSRDPECDLARALLARGFTGFVTMLDESGRPRSRINIEKAAGLCTKEGPHGPYFAKAEQTLSDRPPTAGSDDGAGEVAATCERALAVVRRRAS